MGAAWKLVSGSNGLHAQIQADIDAAFPLTRPEWDVNSAECMKRLQVYHQILMGASERLPDYLRIYLK